jgi:DNA polymerase/3'-5' exonuclease PolX
MNDSLKYRCLCTENQVAHDVIFEKARTVSQACEHSFQMKMSYLKAAKSIRKFPLPITSVEDALALDGVGKTTAKFIMQAIQAQPRQVGQKQISALEAPSGNISYCCTYNFQC